MVLMHPFAPYLKFETSEALQELDGFQRDGFRVRRVIFKSHTVEQNGKAIPSKIFAAIAIPDGPGPHPGILVLHGGTGSAEVDRAVAWARRGYVAVAPDLPGIGLNERMPHSEGAWKSEAYGQGFWRADPDATQSSTLIYATDSPLPWKDKVWQAIPAQLVSGTEYAAQLSDDLNRDQTCWFAFVTDERSVSVSSPVVQSYDSDP